MKRPALQNERVVALRMAFRAGKVFGTFEKLSLGDIIVLIRRMIKGLVHHLHLAFGLFLTFPCLTFRFTE